MLAVTVYSQSQTPDITASTCASPDGFTSCYQQASAITTKCAAAAGSDETLLLVCGCQGAILEIGCALANCWNVVGPDKFCLRTRDHANVFRKGVWLRIPISGQYVHGGLFGTTDTILSCTRKRPRWMFL